MKCTLICNTEDIEKANLLAYAFGYGKNNFSVPLSASGNEPATHYGGFAAGGVSRTLLDLLTNAQKGILPDVHWPDELPENEVLPLLGRLNLVFNQSWTSSLSDAGLKTIRSNDQ